MNTQHLEEMGCKFGEALARLKARHMMRSLPMQAGGASVINAGVTDSLTLPQTSTFVDDDDFTPYVCSLLNVNANASTNPQRALTLEQSKQNSQYAQS